jgi:hypothetical protein
MPNPSPVPSATPAAPAGPGEHAVTFAHPPAVIAALLRAMVPPPAPPAGRRRLVRWTLVTLVLAAGGAALALDDRLDFPRGAFAWLVPFAWLGVIAVLNATHPRPPALAGWLRSVGCLIGLGLALVVAAFLAYVVLVQPFTGGGREGRSWGLFIFGSLVTIVLGLIIARVLHAGGDLKSDVVARLRAAADVAEALSDDAASGKPASGWIDVSGHEQPAKRLREGTAASGVKVTLYRDEWLRLRLALRDGNRLRLSAVDRVKVRAGRWKRGTSGKQKWKSGRSDWLSTVELQLVVNPAAYRVKDGAPAGAPRPSVKAGTAPGAGPALSLVHSTSPKAFDPAEVLRVVAGLYARLERVAAAA